MDNIQCSALVLVDENFTTNQCTLHGVRTESCQQPLTQYRFWEMKYKKAPVHSTFK